MGYLADYWVVIALLSPIVALIAAFLLWLRRPHLPNKVPKGSLVRIFARERSAMFVPILQKHGLTTEFEDILVTADVTLAEHFFRTPEHTAYRSRFYLGSSYFLPHMDGVLSMQGDMWKRHTRALAALFGVKNIMRHLETMNTAAVKHAKAWSLGVAASDGKFDQSEFQQRLASECTSSRPSVLMTGGPDLLDAVRGISMEVLFAWAYGLTWEHPLAPRLSELLAAYGRAVGQIGQRPLAIMCAYAHMHSVGEQMQQVVYKLIDERQGVEKDPNAPVDGISLMMEAGLSKKEIAAEVNHVHGAHKAAGFVLTHLLHDLGQTATYVPVNGPVVSISDVSGAWWADRIRAELSTVVNSSNASSSSSGGVVLPSRDMLISGKLPLTRAVLLEATRKHSVSLGVVRRTGLDVNIAGTVIPAFTEVVVLLEALHTMPCYWMRPYEFRPERWMSKTVLENALKAQSALFTGDEDAPESMQHKQPLIDCNSIVVGTAVSALDAGSRDASGTSTNAVSDDSASSNGLTFSLHREKASQQLLQSVRTPEERVVHAPPYSFEPFLTGSRMCNGKVLAETELLVCLAAILRTVRVKTNLEYVGHINGAPFGCDAGVRRKMYKLWGVQKHFEQGNTSNATIQVEGANIEIRGCYDGPFDILLSDSMYSTIEGSVPFTEEPL